MDFLYYFCKFSVSLKLKLTNKNQNNYGHKDKQCKYSYSSALLQPRGGIGGSGCLACEEASTEDLNLSWGNKRALR